MTNIKPSWRDANTVHPLADKLPMLSPDELQERPARTDHDGRGRRQEQLLDGRNRLAACFLLGLKPKTEMADPKHTKDPPTLAHTLHR